MLKPILFLKKTQEKGKGVYTRERIRRNTIIEIAPVVVMSAKDRVLLDQTLLHDYIFEWGPSHDQCAMALGYVPMYNHSYNSNCEYYMDFEEQTIMVKTLKTVEAGEELTINYNGDSDDQNRLWFEAK